MSSSIHFRSQFNVQYTMAYLLYITTTHVTLTPENVFDELDKNKTGAVTVKDLEELQHMRFRSTKKEISYFIDAGLNCLKTQDDKFDNNRNLQDYYSKQILRSAFLQCPAIVDYIRRKGILKPKYKHTLDTDDNYVFVITKNIMPYSRWMLNWITNNPRKFIAINDEMDHSKMIATAVELELKNFYERLFPTPSQFELQVT
ncbi:N-acetylglucosamine-1-phosphotransferase subunits alpha/beta-like [Ruditapes philippinarum]|uniref:N-acetylglucosamine-1-phosphotransferase subunits alpha/beta-like n=1 Tax=Ruditapes philippinarum TaxID=129788 RepID=UPI00295A5A14|nr:N-acetylglucosamine-1-phosphotransferase subunits alpha/beta-like [Ruditapes philippinarum]